MSFVETHGSASPSEERVIDALKLKTKKCLPFLCSETHCRASLHKTNRTKKNSVNWNMKDAQKVCNIVCYKLNFNKLNTTWYPTSGF